jgi:hypothetical protein
MKELQSFTLEIPNELLNGHAIDDLLGNLPNRSHELLGSLAKFLRKWKPSKVATHEITVESLSFGDSAFFFDRLNTPDDENLLRIYLVESLANHLIRHSYTNAQAAGALELLLQEKEDEARQELAMFLHNLRLGLAESTHRELLGNVGDSQSPATVRSSSDVREILGHIDGKRAKERSALG